MNPPRTTHVIAVACRFFNCSTHLPLFWFVLEFLFYESLVLRKAMWVRKLRWCKKSEGREARYVWLALLMTNKHASIKKYVDILSRFVVAELVSKSHAAFCLDRQLRVTSLQDLTHFPARRLIQARMRCSASGTMPGNVHSNTILIQLAREICFVLHL